MTYFYQASMLNLRGDFERWGFQKTFGTVKIWVLVDINKMDLCYSMSMRPWDPGVKAHDSKVVCLSQVHKDRTNDS